MTETKTETELGPCPWCKERPAVDNNHWASITHKPDCWRTLIIEDRVEHFHERTFAAWNTRTSPTVDQPVADKCGHKLIVREHYHIDTLGHIADRLCRCPLNTPPHRFVCAPCVDSRSISPPIDEVESALAELREMFPDYQCEIRQYYFTNFAPGEMAVSVLVRHAHARSEFTGNSLAECMAAVRLWRKG